MKVLYETCLEKAALLEKIRRLFDGQFGLTKGPADDPCHDAFTAEDPESQAVREVLE